MFNWPRDTTPSGTKKGSLVFHIKNPMTSGAGTELVQGFSYSYTELLEPPQCPFVQNPKPCGEKEGLGDCWERKRIRVFVSGCLSSNKGFRRSIMEGITEGVNNMNVSDSSSNHLNKKNRIQVSNTKKPLFFYVNLAKVNKPFVFFFSALYMFLVLWFPSFFFIVCVWFLRNIEGLEVIETKCYATTFWAYVFVVPELVSCSDIMVGWGEDKNELSNWTFCIPSSFPSNQSDEPILKNCALLLFFKFFPSAVCDH